MLICGLAVLMLGLHFYFLFSFCGILALILAFLDIYLKVLSPMFWVYDLYFIVSKFAGFAYWCNVSKYKPWDHFANLAWVTLGGSKKFRSPVLLCPALVLVFELAVLNAGFK